MSRNYVASAKDYARDVTDGRILACRYVRLACRRFLDDLKRQKQKSFPYTLDEKAATKVCAFIELLPHVKGKWAREKQRIHLEPWQCFIEVNVFGWKRKSDGLRRYRRFYGEIPRKNAKSTTTAATADYMLVGDDEHGAEVYSGATTEKQAWEVFGPARLMVLKTPQLLQHYHVTVGAKNLHVLHTASKFEPIIGKPGDGASPSMSITDEYHEHQSPEQYDTMVTGMGAREQPIAWVITTAGSDIAGPCYALRQQVVDMLEGKVDHPELFGIIYTIDTEDEKDTNGKVVRRAVDWTSEDALRMANPNMDVSVRADFLRTEQQRAIKSPREQAKFKTKHLNIWVTAASPYYNAESWKRLADPALSIDDFAGEPCTMGLDMASTQDIAGYLRLFARTIDEERHYYVFPRFYVPQARAEEPTHAHYAEWVEQGHMTPTLGNSADYDTIETDIKADGDRFPLLQLGFDPWNAGQMSTHLQDHFGADKVIQVPQTVAQLSWPMKHIGKLIADGLIHHDGNPALAWMMGNVTAQEDRNDNVFPRKEGPERKIDGAIMLIIAMNRGLVAFEDTAEPSIAFLSWSGV